MHATDSATETLSRPLIDEALAHAIDDGTFAVAALHPLLAGLGLYRSGVPTSAGGDGAPLLETVRIIASLSEQSLAAGLAAWSQRSCIHYLIHAVDDGAASRILPSLLDGSLAGAIGPALQQPPLQAAWDGDEVRLDGRLAWIPNLVPGRFVVALAGRLDEDAVVALVQSTSAGSQLQPDLATTLNGIAAAPLELADVRLGAPWILARDGRHLLSRVEPGVLLLQCGLMLGLIRRALNEVDQAPAASRRVLGPSASRLRRGLRHAWRTVAGLSTLRSAESPGMTTLIRLRVSLVRLADAAVRLESEAVGGIGILSGSGTSRRIRESAFLSALPPTVVQLEDHLALAKQPSHRLPSSP